MTERIGGDPINCIPCVFKKDLKRTGSYCTRRSMRIVDINTCSTGPVDKFPKMGQEMHEHIGRIQEFWNINGRTGNTTP